MTPDEDKVLKAMKKSENLSVPEMLPKQPESIAKTSVKSLRL